MNKVFTVFFLFVILIVLMFSLSHAFSTKEGGHKAITDKAAAIEKAFHVNDDQFRSWIDGSVSNPGALQNFLTGVHDEDCTPVIEGATIEVPYDLDWPSGPNKNLWGNFFEHFYNPMTGAGLTRLLMWR